MKKLILGTALALMAASPVLAQGSYGPHRATRLDDIRAQAMPTLQSDAVFVDGRYAGTDPDPNVRLQLQKDSSAIVDR